MPTRSKQANPCEPQSSAVSAPKKTKSRNGCQECKKKRRKCDETKPGCTQCKRCKTECPGYRKSFRWSTKYEVLQPPHTKESQWPQRDAEALTSSLQTMSRMQSSGRFREFREPSVAIFVPSSDAHSPVHQLSPAESIDSPGDASSIESTEIVFPGTPEASLDPRREGTNEKAREAYFVDSHTTLSDTTNDFLSYVAGFTESGESQPNVDLTSLLTEYWYTDACRKYSTYDSITNRNRQLAMSLCSRSEAVSCAMQSMSAACLVETLPQARGILSSLISRTLCAIRHDLTGFLSARTLVHMGVPVESLFATFALGTAMLWSNSRDLAFSLRDKAAKMLDLCDVDDEPADSQERKDYEYFRSCLVHWDSQSFTPNLRLECKLVSLRCGDSERPRADISIYKLEEFGLGEYKNDLPTTLLRDSQDTIALHPSTGISSKVQETFALVMCLCRQERAQQQRQSFGNWSPYSTDDMATNDAMARKLKDQLVSFKFEDALISRNDCSSEHSMTSQTDDTSTPGWHLLCVAESFRISALLNLYLTFPGLSIAQETSTDFHEPLFRQSSSYSSGHTNPRRRDISQLALRLVELVGQLNAESGTACIQPLLYLSAASGLMYDGSFSGESSPGPTKSSTPKPRQDSGVESYEQVFNSFLCSSFTTKRASLTPLEKDGSKVVTAHTWRIAIARRQVIKGLERLQERLPPRVGEVTLQLTKAILAAYDSGDGAYGQDLHWLDVVDALDIRTPFG